MRHFLSVLPSHSPLLFTLFEKWRLPLSGSKLHCRQSFLLQQYGLPFFSASDVLVRAVQWNVRQRRRAVLGGEWLPIVFAVPLLERAVCRFPSKLHGRLFIQRLPFVLTRSMQQSAVRRVPFGLPSGERLPSHSSFQIAKWKLLRLSGE